jgi:hypothetical protein
MALKRGRWMVLGALLAVALFVGLALELNPPVTRTTTGGESSPSSTLGESSSSVQLQSSTSVAKGIIVPSSSASTLDSRTGLSLNLNLSTNSNGWVIVTAYELNTLDRINNVSGRGSWPNNTSLFQWERFYCYARGMAGYEILQGNYGLNNFSQGTALWLQPKPSIMDCIPDFPPDTYTFKPLSEAGIVSGTHVGFWEGGSTYSPFAPGIYTVLSGDEWDNVVILHFAVNE